MRAQMQNISKLFLPARRALRLALVAGVVLASARCANDMVEVIPVAETGGLGVGGSGLPGGMGPRAGRDTIIAFSRQGPPARTEAAPDASLPD